MPRPRRKKLQIAVYDGDDEVCTGTIDECAEKLGILPKTIRYYMTPTYQRRSAEWRDDRSRHVLILDGPD